MPIFTVHLYADGPKPAQTADVSLTDTTDARHWASNKVMANGTFTHAQIYDGERFLSEVGYRINPPWR